MSFRRSLMICGVMISFFFPQFWASASTFSVVCPAPASLLLAYWAPASLLLVIWAPASLMIWLFWAPMSLSDFSASDSSAYTAVETKPFCDKMFVTRSGSLSFTPCNIFGTKVFAIACICNEALPAGISLFVLFPCVEMSVSIANISLTLLGIFFQGFLFIVNLWKRKDKSLKN